MINQKQKERLIQVAKNAAELFMAKGYIHTQMLDVALKMGVSVGTLYIYVKSKKALFDFTLQLIFNDYNLPDDLELPLQEIDHDYLMSHIISPLVKKHNDNIKTVIEKSDNKRQEMEEIIRLTFSYLSQYRTGIHILERNELSWPELTDFFFKIRARYIKQIASYLAKGIELGIIRPLENVEISARLILESIAWFAMHRHYDRDLKNLENKQAMETVVDALTHAFYKG
jgi:AcrR family transcriptional regulator